MNKKLYNCMLINKYSSDLRLEFKPITISLLVMQYFIAHQCDDKIYLSNQPNSL